MLQQTSGNSSQFVDQELTHEFLRCENEKNPIQETYKIHRK